MYIMLQTLSTLMHIILEGNINGNEFENVEIITAVSDFIYNTGRFINFIDYLTKYLIGLREDKVYLSKSSKSCIRHGRGGINGTQMSRPSNHG